MERIVGEWVRVTRHAGRRLLKRPLLVVVAGGTLALAVGAAVAIFSVIDRAVLRPLPIPHAEDVFTVQRAVPMRTGGVWRLTALPWVATRDLARISGPGIQVAFATDARDNASQQMAVRVGPSQYTVDGQFISANFLRILGVAPLVGRDFTREDDIVGATPVALLSYEFWQSAFAASPTAVGARMDVHGTPVVVIGVLPSSFHGLSVGEPGPAVWFPLMTGSALADGLPSDGAYGVSTGPVPTFVPSPVSPLAEFETVIRVTPGRVQQTSARIEALGGTSNWRMVGLTQTLLPSGVQSQLRTFVAVLAGTVCLILLIGMAGLASVLVARTEERRGELAVCAALGASRTRLAIEAAAEACLLVGTGGAAAFLVAPLLIRALGRFALPGGVDIGDLPVSLDWRALTAAVVCTAVVGALVGLAPATRAASRHLALELVSLPSHLRQFRLLRVLMAVQVSVCVVLVFLAALFVRTMSNALGTDIGFDQHHLVAVTVRVPNTLRRAGPARAEQLLRQVRSLPEVSVAAIGRVPTLDNTDATLRTLRVDGAPPDPRLSLDVVYADNDYFRTLGQPVIHGRGFTPQDRGGSMRVAVVNRAAASLLWGATDPIGHRLGVVYATRSDNDYVESDYAIVGVAGNVKFGTLRDDNRPVLYLSRTQNDGFLAGSIAASGQFRVMVRTTTSDATMAAALASTVVRNGLSVASVESVSQRIDQMLMPQRLGRFLLLLLALLALAISLVGTYGLAGCIAAQSTREAGIRLALGASSSQVLSALLKRTFVPVLWGAAIGTGVSVLAERLVSTFLYGQDTFPVIVLSSAVLAILATSLVTAIVGLRKTGHLSPVALMTT
jgi:predicted permease